SDIVGPRDAWFVTVYDPVTNAWTPRAAAGSGRGYPGVLLPTVAAVPGKGIVVAGGDDGTSYLSDPFGIGAIYDPAVIQWSANIRSPVLWSPNAKNAMASGGVVNGELYLVGYLTFQFIP